MGRPCIFGCSPEERSKTTHRFPSPKFPKIYSAWLKLIPSRFDKENFDYRKYRVCDRHFESEAKYGTRNRLKRTAVPKLHLPVDTHLPRSESISIDLPTLSSHVVENDGRCVVENPIEVEVVSSTWGRLIHDDSIPYVGEIYCASDCIGEILPQSHLSRPEDVQPFYGSMEPEDTNNYCELLHLWSKLHQKYIELAAKVKSLRRTVRNFRKGRPSYQTRLSEAERMVDKIDELTKPVKVFCKMQFSQCNKKLKGRRFTFDEKLLSLALYKKSPKTYKSLLYKMFTLPSAKSLKRLLSQVKLSPGTDSHVIFKFLKRQASLSASEDRLCSLIFDEMSITPQLHFNPFKDELKGLDTKDCKLANHVLVFMIKTIKNNFKQPVAYYFTNSLSRFELKNILQM